MVLGNEGAKSDAYERASEHAREYDRAHCDGTHGRTSSLSIFMVSDPDQTVLAGPQKLVWLTQFSLSHRGCDLARRRPSGRNSPKR
jgi:hypothetical protein